jgi:hypothetical protein
MSDPRGTVYGRAPYPPPPEPPRRRGIMRVVGFFDTTAKIIGAFTAVIVATAGLWAAIVSLRGEPSGPTQGPTATVDAEAAANRVQNCERAHGMTKAQVVKTTDEGLPYLFQYCVWPRPPYADTDGYIEISVVIEQGVAGAVEADGTSLVSRIRGSCNTYVLQYDFGKMGNSRHLPPFEATPGALLFGGEGDRYDGPKSDLKFYPPADEIDVLHNASYYLASASCKN